MNYSKNYIASLAIENSFIKYNIEKVLRLLDVLDFIFNKSNFSSFLLLKGGTAINLIYTKLNRLSVDIDLDYYHYLDKENTIKDKDLILKDLDEYMVHEGYKIMEKNSKMNPILISRVYSYINADGNKDNIKIEINFINRISLYPPIKEKINYFSKSITLTSLIKEELYGMKIVALIDRSKPRDLYDVNYLFTNIKDINLIILKKIVIFYLSLDGIYKVDDNLFLNISSLTFSSIRKELFPVIKKGTKFDLEVVKESVIKKLIDLLTLDDNEKEYLKEFSKGNFNPSLLFDNDIALRADKHPMALWKILNIKHKQ